MEDYIRVARSLTVLGSDDHIDLEECEANYRYIWEAVLARGLSNDVVDSTRSCTMTIANCARFFRWSGDGFKNHTNQLVQDLQTLVAIYDSQPI